MIFVGENLWPKSTQNFSGKYREIWGKILQPPKNVLAPTPMLEHHAIAVTFLLLLLYE